MLYWETIQKQYQKGGSSMQKMTPEEYRSFLLGTARTGKQDRAEEYGQRNGVQGEYLLRLKPTKIIARKNISD